MKKDFDPSLITQWITQRNCYDKYSNDLHIIDTRLINVANMKLQTFAFIRLEMINECLSDAFLFLLAILWIREIIVNTMEAISKHCYFALVCLKD